MKLRNGFVSNSSSSSFLILGVNTRKARVNSEVLALLPDYWETDDEHAFIQDSDCNVVGQFLCRCSDGDMVEIDPSTITPERVRQVAETLMVPEEKVRIILYEHYS